jgi:nucleotide-binding universal stress UspA family protein
MNPPKQIIVATDFSATAEAALEYAATFAKSIGAKIALVHVYQIPNYSYPDVLVPTPPEVAREIEDAARTATIAARERYASSGVDIEPVVLQGRAWQEILRLADERAADLVVVGTHGRSGVSRALLGSVAEKVLRTATRPVLVIPMKKGTAP